MSDHSAPSFSPKVLPTVRLALRHHAQAYETTQDDTVPMNRE